MNNSKRKILLVEDNSDDLEFIQLALNELGTPHEIVVAEDGEQAIDYLLGNGEFAERNKLENPEISLLDLKFPKLTSLEVLKLIRANKHTAHIPIVIFTSSNIQSDVLTAYQLGANSVVTKPIESKLFMECVKLMGTYWLSWNHPPPAK
jgi:two-component system response regulator